MAPVLIDGFGFSHKIRKKPKLTQEEIDKIIVKIVKKDFEYYFNMSYSTFEERYKYLLKNNPEKLI